MRKFISIAALAAMTLVSCNNAKLGVKENILYFESAASGQKSEMVTLEGGKTDLPMQIRLAQKAESDTEITLGFDATIIEAFNKANSTDYVAIPEQYLPTDTKVIIPKGEVGATYNLHLEGVVSDGATYAVPVKIASSSNANIPISSVQSQFVYVLSIPLSVPVPTMNPTFNDDRVNCAPAETDWGLEVENWTLECWVKMSGFSKNNQAIFNSGNASKGCELYVRFGDANYPYNYLQAKIAGNNDISTERDWQRNRWYHFAIVCTKADSKVRFYRDGVMIKEAGVTYPSDGLFKIDHFQMVSSGPQWFVDDCSMSQVKLWNVARTPKELKDNMYFSANPKNPALIAYWPLTDKDNPGTFADVTGNGHDGSYPQSLVSEWSENVDFKN